MLTATHLLRDTIVCLILAILTFAAQAQGEVLRVESGRTYDGQGRTVTGIIIDSVTDAVVKNYVVKGTSQAGVLVESSERVILEDCKISGFQMGIWVKGARDSSLLDNYITGCQIGMSVSGWVLVEGNEIDGLFLRGLGDSDYARGWNGKNSGGPLVFRNNWFHGADVVMLEAAGSHVDGFQSFTQGGGQLHNFVFEGNVIEDFHQGMLAQDTGRGSTVPSTKQTNWVVRNNVFARGRAWIATIENVNGFVFENNYAVDITPQGLGIRFGTVATSIRRNIIETRIGIWSDPESSIEDVGSNVYFGTTRNRLGAATIDLDPMIVSPSPGVYRFAQDSPLAGSSYGPAMLNGGPVVPPEPIPTITPTPTPDPLPSPTATATPTPTSGPPLTGAERKAAIRAALDEILNQIIEVEENVWP